MNKVVESLNANPVKLIKIPENVQRTSAVLDNDQKAEDSPGGDSEENTTPHPLCLAAGCDEGLTTYRRETRRRRESLYSKICPILGKSFCVTSLKFCAFILEHCNCLYTSI